VAASLSKFHPASPIIAIVNNPKEARSLALNFAVYPVLSKEGAEELIAEFGLDEDEIVLEVTKSGLRLLQIK